MCMHIAIYGVQAMPSTEVRKLAAALSLPEDIVMDRRSEVPVRRICVPCCLLSHVDRYALTPQTSLVLRLSPLCAARIYNL